MSDTAPTAADFAAVFQGIDAETTRIADYVSDLLDQLDRSRPDALSDSAAAEVLSTAKAELEKLRGIGKLTVSEPEPEPEPVPVTEQNPTPEPEPEPEEPPAEPTDGETPATPAEGETP